jgi:hypothetical protein
LLDGLSLLTTLDLTEHPFRHLVATAEPLLGNDSASCSAVLRDRRGGQRLDLLQLHASSPPPLFDDKGEDGALLKGLSVLR